MSGQEAKIPAADCLLNVRKLGQHVGAEITGLNLSATLDAQTRAAFIAAWREHLVLVVPQQHLSPAELVALAAGFGKLDSAPPFDNKQSSLPGYPEVAVVSNVVEQGKVIGGLGSGELVWHSDMTYRPEPPVGCILSAVELPRQGGDTHFVSMAAAYQELPPETRDALCGLKLRHDARYTSAGTERQPDKYQEGSEHPIIVTDPLSGQDVLFLGRRRQSSIIGLDESGSKKILDPLWDHVDSGGFTVAHHWRLGDVVFWANMAVMHRRDPFEESDRRILYRAQIAALTPQYA